jgi:NADH/F420H2 dehydrogenase subunit C
VSDPAGRAALVRERLGPDAVREAEFRGEVTVVVPGARVLDTLRVLHGAPGGPPVLTDLTAVDRHPAAPRFEVVYLLTWYAPPMRLRVRAVVADDPPVVASVVGLWAGADWLEREAYDMFGIRFEGHPRLSRILMPDDWEGYPLRKDFPLTEEPVEFLGHTPRTPSDIIPRTPPRP